MSKINISTCKSAVYEGNGKSRCVIWDDNLKGFGLRVYPTGRKAFILSYRASGRKKLYTIGEYGVLTPQQARQEAQKLLAMVGQGEDPKDRRRKARESQVVTSELVGLYLERHAPRKKTGRQDERMLGLYLPNSWQKRELKGITRADVAKLHQKLGHNNGPYAANRFLALLRKMFNLAVDWGLLPESHPNPCTRIEQFKEEKRERFVTPEELPKLWQAIQTEESPYWRGFFLLNLFLGARKGEILAMRWEDIDIKRGIWLIPETKAGRSHHLPLPLEAIEVLKNLPVLQSSEWVFPSHGKTGHLAEPKSAWARICLRASLKNIRIHDLRRTVGSWLAAQGESLPMIGKVLNHSQPSSTAIYARLHIDPVREAMEKHSRNLSKVLANSDKGTSK